MLRDVTQHCHHPNTRKGWGTRKSEDWLPAKAPRYVKGESRTLLLALIEMTPRTQGPARAAGTLGYEAVSPCGLKLGAICSRGAET